MVHDTSVRKVRREMDKGHLKVDIVGSRSMDRSGIRIVNIY